MKPAIKRFLLHFLLIIGILAVVVLFTQSWLKHFTRHGQSLTVPDFTGMTVEQTQRAAVAHSLKIELLDSLFIPNKPRGTVFRQIPQAGEKVKKNRRILITINSILPRQVNAPSLVGFTLRQAKAELVSQNFQLGTLSYQNDFATNTVLEQRYRGAPLHPGTPIDAHSVIDLVLGVSPGNNIAYVPGVVGLNLEIAKDLITDHSLNVGIVRYDATVQSGADSLAAIVVRQEPSESTVVREMGGRVNLFLSIPKPL
ncbi:MAG: PASTA domain-containing protein [Bacteroidales bacterium]|nr:PASTA domain-containing protein [Bacteroidales bacterium]